MKKKLFIIGGSGLVGSTLVDYAINDFDIHVTYNKNLPENTDVKSTKIDLLKEKTKIVSLLESIKPDIVIHTAAHSSVDLCEEDHKIADLLHVDVTQKITDICKKMNSKLIYISTDAVFAGQLNKKYTEMDMANPLNYYGKTKLKAENIILSSPKNVILRSSVIYGWHKKSKFTGWILGYLRERKPVDPFSDQYNTPTLVDDLAKSILSIINLNVSGLFHACGKTCINRYDFAIALAAKFGYDEKLITSVTSIEKKQIAPRPISTCLDSTKLEKIINFEFSDIQKGINFIFQKSKLKNFD